jgi:probable phosphoglycerate mutase
LDPELTSEGSEMARQFAEVYRETPWKGVFSSALKRTVSTAQPLCDAIGMKSEPRAELNEIAYGSWEGLTKATVEVKFHDDYIRWLADPAWHAPTNGELAVSIARRSMKLIEDINANCSGDGNILFVSHKATIRIILCALLGVDVGRFRYRFVCPVGSVSTVEFTSEGPLLHSLADRSHLSAVMQSLKGT